MNYLFHALIFIWIFLRVNGGLFDRCSGKKVDEALAKELKSRNATEQCTIEIRPCTPHEGSRVDGTCNNYKYPSTGSARGPYLRILKPDYGNNTRVLRASRKGASLPSARKVRTALQTTGRVEDKHTFSAAAPHFLHFIGRDVSAMNGPMDYLQKRQYCCQPEGKADPRCMPIKVPEDDPYLRVTDIRCLNFSRAETFQDVGCAPSVTPEQINFQTPLLDLSTIYGIDDNALDSVRTFRNGLLKPEESDGPVDTPISSSNLTKETNTTESNGPVVQDITKKDICMKNTSNGTVCYQFGYPEMRYNDLRTTSLAILFIREHNRLAKILRQMHPCWKDDRLFKVARQINIATAANIFMYELLPELLGYDNMLNYRLISDRVEHITAYNEDEVPLVYAEYDIATRFFHTMLDGRVKRYDENYHYVGEFPLSETLFRQGLIEQDKTFEEINRGTFFQNAGNIDDIQDPEISENFYGKLQRAHDLAAMDIQRGRDVGVRGYNEYRHLCGLKQAEKFEDFLDVMNYEKVLALKKLYEDVDDVDLLAGIMSEGYIKGTYVGTTLFCIMAKQLQVFRFADRFWFERGDQFHSLTLAQLHEVRRTSMARLACDNAPHIKFIQPQAFRSAGHGNLHVPCTHIPGPDLSKWQDNSCQKRHEPTKGSKQKYGQENKRQQQMAMDYSTFFDRLLAYDKP